MTTEQRRMDVDEALRIIQAPGHQPRLQEAFAYLHMLEARASRYDEAVKAWENRNNPGDHDDYPKDYVEFMLPESRYRAISNALTPDAPRQEASDE